MSQTSIPANVTVNQVVTTRTGYHHDCSPGGYPISGCYGTSSNNCGSGHIGVGQSVSPPLPVLYGVLLIILLLVGGCSVFPALVDPQAEPGLVQEVRLT